MCEKSQLYFLRTVRSYLTSFLFILTPSESHLREELQPCTLTLATNDQSLNDTLMKLTDWMFWNCAEVRDRLVGGVEKVCPWGGVEVQDVTPLQGDCFPESVTGVWEG